MARDIVSLFCLHLYLIWRKPACSSPLSIAKNAVFRVYQTWHRTTRPRTTRTTCRAAVLSVGRTRLVSRNAAKPLWRQTSGKIDRISIQQNFLTQGIEEEPRPPHDSREAVCVGASGNLGWPPEENRRMMLNTAGRLTCARTVVFWRIVVSGF